MPSHTINNSRLTASILLLFLFTLPNGLLFTRYGDSINEISNDGNVNYGKLDLIQSSYQEYSPAAKSIVSEGDSLIYLIQDYQNNTLTQYSQLYEIQTIQNVLGILQISANIYQKNSSESTWGSPQNSNIVVGALDLNHVSIGLDYILQHQYFSFEFQGYDDDQTAQELQINQLKSDYLTTSMNSTVSWKDYFNPVLSCQFSNSTHYGAVQVEYLDGILSQYTVSYDALLGGENHTTSILLDIAASSIQKKAYSYYGDPNENIPLTASEEIINTDFLVYLHQDGNAIDVPAEMEKFTITSIDSGVNDRFTVITTSLETFDADVNDWDFQGSHLLFVDHSQGFSLRKFQEHYYVKPTTFEFKTTETLEELEASKYWMEIYDIWSTFTYEINKTSYTFTLSDEINEIHVHAEYTPNMVLALYELTYTTNGEITYYEHIELDLDESNVYTWNITPPASPEITRITSTTSENLTIEFSWNAPYYASSYSIYLVRRTGTNSSKASPATEMYIPILERYSLTHLSFEGLANNSYYFMVTAINSYGAESEFSDPVDFYILPASEGNSKHFSWGWFLFGLFLVGGVGFAVFYLKKIKKKEVVENELDLSQFK